VTRSAGRGCELDSQPPKKSNRWNATLSVAGNLALPVARSTWDEFFNTVDNGLPLISRTVGAALKRSLLQRLAFTAVQVAKHEFSDVCPANDGLAQATGLLLRGYPGLARLWIVQCQNWKAFVRDFLGHASVFLKTISRDSILTSVKPDLSDLHGGNRAVIKVRLADGSQWYYKPRSGRQEVIWSRLLQEINRAGFRVYLTAPRIVCGSAHCWMEARPSRACRNRSEVRSHAYRAGALLYLLYRLRGVDFHSDNVVADGAHPVLVDCETLLHPDPVALNHMTVEQALIRTGMLPFDNYERAAMRTIRGRRKLVPYSQFAQVIATGFVAMHAFLGRKNTDLVNRTVALLSEQGVRWVYRSSLQYWEILRRSLAPDLMRDSAGRGMFLQACCQGPPPSIAREEASALEQADIPLLTTKAAKPRPAPSASELKQCCVALQMPATL
jgi:lantibiotic modifying enzyme